MTNRKPAPIIRIQPVPERDGSSPLRQQRVANYRVKLAAGFRCSFPHCKQAHGILVVVDENGELAARCERHREGMKSTPGQWDERTVEGE